MRHQKLFLDFSQLSRAEVSVMSSYADDDLTPRAEASYGQQESGSSAAALSYAEQYQKQRLTQPINSQEPLKREGGNETDETYSQMSNRANCTGNPADGTNPSDIENLQQERSEEHTPELQSRPHISYAVFCLKKKKKKQKQQK